MEISKIWPCSIIKTNDDMQATTKQLSNEILQWIDGNKIHYGYIRWIDNPRMATHIIWEKTFCNMLPFIWYFFHVKVVPYWFRRKFPVILMFPKFPPYWVSLSTIYANSPAFVVGFFWQYQKKIIIYMPPIVTNAIIFINMYV